MLEENSNATSNNPVPSSPQNTATPDEVKKPVGFNLKLNKNSILIAIAVLAVVITGVLIFGNSKSGNFFSIFSSSSKEVLAQKAIDYINANLLDEGQGASLGEVSKESGLVKFEVKLGNNVFDSYITKDGRLLFTSPPIVIEANTNSTANSTNSGGTTKVSADNDPVLGDANAPVTIIEFSDYECPFCKRHFQQVYPQIKKNYIDTGKVKLVFRDFVAVQGHNPLARSEAMAAECAREQGGDAIYFKYHDEIFKKTTSNGDGLELSELASIATKLGLNATSLQQCLHSNKYKEEFEKDNADALSYLPRNDAGTPSFFIGKSTADGMIEGTLIKGAQPYSAFQATIDGLLK